MQRLPTNEKSPETGALINDCGAQEGLGYYLPPLWNPRQFRVTGLVWVEKY